MKNFLTFLSFLLPFFILNLNGQNYLSENFDGASLPTGWSIQGQSSNWSISSTNNAGGDPRELQLTWNPQFNGKTRVISPVINTSGATDLVITFLQYLDNFSGSHIIGIETTSNGGATWNPAFQKTFSSTQGSRIMEAISTADVGSPNFQFCLFYQGNSYNINDWYFDNFLLFGRYGTDANLLSINNPIYIATGNHNISFTVLNSGFSAINSMEVQFKLNDGAPVLGTFSSLNIQTLAFQTLSFTAPVTLEPGIQAVTVEILSVNGAPDDNPANNLVTKNFSVATQQVDRKVCIEHFTSSTCAPCVSVNTQMKNLLANTNNANKFGITKYQMNWPGSGDPYYTAEGGVRRTYYAVSGVPTVFFNAKPVAVNQTAFNNALAAPAFVKISGDFSIDGNNIIIQANVLSHLIIPEARLYVIVNEKHTTGNVGSNGEKDFYHVMMKILPNGQGETVSFQLDEMKTFNYNFNMSSTKVEEMDDLEVHVFLQENSTKYIFNSSFLSNCEPPTAPDNFVAQHVDNDVVLTWSDAHGTSESFTVFFNGEKLADNITSTTFTHINVSAGDHTYGVCAVEKGCTSINTETSIEICGNPENFSGEQVEHSVELTWETTYGASNLLFNGNIIATNIIEHNYTHENVPEGTHTYGIIAVGVNCISETIEITVKVEYDGIHDYYNNIKIYPNPANNYFVVEGKYIETISIYNNIGQLIKNISTSEETVRIDTNDMNSGLYHLQIITKSGIIIPDKIMIAK